MWKQKLSHNFNVLLTYRDQFNRLYYLLKGCTVTRFMTGQRRNFPTADTLTTTVSSVATISVSYCFSTLHWREIYPYNSVVKTHRLHATYALYCIPCTPIINMVICCSFNTSVNYPTLLQCRNDWSAMNNESERRLEKLIFANFTLCPSNFLETLRKCGKISGATDQIRTRHRPNTTQNCYRRT